MPIHYAESEASGSEASGSEWIQKRVEDKAAVTCFLLSDLSEMHEVAIAASVARVLLILAASGLPEVSHRAKLHHDGPA